MVPALPPRSAKQIRNPMVANRFAAASPIPPAAPVTTATRPLESAGCSVMVTPISATRLIYRAGVLRFTVTFLRSVKLSSENSRPMPLCL